jgi:dipeptidase E
MSNLLMLSNSTLPGTPFFTWPKPWVKEFLNNDIKEVLFIPFAAVTFSMDEYTQKVREVFNSMRLDVQSIHDVTDKLQAVNNAQAIVVGGGNTFALLSRMYIHNLVESVRNKVVSGTPYIGWSAGANLACPTIMTTNDMPIVQPPSLAALNLVPFQINAHYHELKFENQGGETRKERLEEFLVLNHNKKIIGLPEGMLLQRNGDQLFVRGDGVAKLYCAGKVVEDLRSDTDLSYLLKN